MPPLDVIGTSFFSRNTKLLKDMRSVMSDVKFFESYSRYIKDDHRYETWEDSVTRVMNMHKQKYAESIAKSKDLQNYIAEAEEGYKKKYILGAQRALQFGGEQLMKHQMRMYNCVSGYADRIEFFGEYFYILLCGAGVGFSVQKHHVAKMPMIRPRTKQPKTHVLDDSIEGWATGLDVLLSSYFIGGGKYPEYEGRKVYFDDSQIRPKGSPISGGFKAPGPEPLIKCLQLCEKVLSAQAEDGVLRPIDVYDIAMHAADAVLSGGVRRAATLCMFSIDDDDMMNAKTENWMEKNPQRARSNNSAMIKRDTVTKDQFVPIFEKVKQFGEPGFIFVDSLEHTFNPCVEIGMYPVFEQGNKKISGWQACNLTEGNGAKATSAEEFFKICKLSAILGTLQAGYTDFKFVSDVTKKIVERESLLGVSITGWMNNPDVLFDKSVLKKGAQIVKETNKIVAKLIGINPAARSTCVKPSGNASVLLGTESGVTPAHASYFIRNIQMSKMQEVAKVVKQYNPYMIEDSVWSSTDADYVISFPIIPTKKSLLRKNLTAVDFLERVKLVQQNWIEHGTDLDLCVDKALRHNVSNTVTVKNTEEWDEVAQYMFDNRQYFTGVSFIGSNGDKDYPQAPYVEILSPKDLVAKYGEASIFASGLIVDAAKGFKNLWEACRVSQMGDDDASQEVKDSRAEWIRRFHKFSSNYFGGDHKETEYCLKDVYMLHKWFKIQHNYQDMPLEDLLKIQKNIDIDTTGAQACFAGGCEI